MRVHQVVAQALSESGVQHVFGLMGDANMHHVVSFIEDHGGIFVSAVDEGAAVSMADGYARVSGSVGVASVTHGPGLTNSLTALTEAVRASSRVVVLTGDTPSRPHHLQRLDIRAAVGVTGAEYIRVLTPDRAVHDLRAALARVCLTERPIVLDVPVDLDTAETDVPSQVSPPVVPAMPGPAPDDLDRALGMVVGARRPVILAGRGAIGARAELLALAELIGAPVATTLLARGLFRGAPCDLGMAGNLGTTVGMETIWSADCVIAFGAGLNRFTTVDGSLLRDRSIVQIDVRADRIGMLAPPQAAVIGDSGLVAAAMVEQLRELDETVEPWYGDDVLAAIARQDPLAEVASLGGVDTLDPRTAMAVLNTVLPADRAVVTDTGRFVYAPWRYLDTAQPTDFAHTLNFASIGLGLATAMGVAVAKPGQPTVAVVGDGGGMMGMAELVTAVRLRLPLLVVVCNDGAYGMEYRALSRDGFDPRHSLLAWPGFADIARGYGVAAAEVRTVPELRAAAAAWAEDPVAPFLIDVRTDPTVDITP